MKFIRFAQHRIERTGHGVLGFITNHGYLDNPTFRGMRQSLMHTFDEIYILDLHGNANKKEVSPDGSKDENVFDIMQGVSIGIFIKRRNGTSGNTTIVRHAELFGLRSDKYSYLEKHTISNTAWNVITPQSPFHLFTPQNLALRAEYDPNRAITEIFPLNGVGLTTARDHVVIDFSEHVILQNAQRFRDSTKSDEEICHELKIPLKLGWSIKNARALIRSEKSLKSNIHPILYRPFDTRLIFYHDSLVWRTAKQVMRHMLAGQNIGLVSARSNKSSEPDHFFCSKQIMETKCGESTTQSVLFPLYLYPSSDAGKLIVDPPGSGMNGRRANLLAEFIIEFAEKLGLEFVPDGVGDLQATFGPEDVFHYAYAVFHCPTYRSRYAQFLKIDFPRLPLTSDRKLFATLCALGAELVGLHLLEHVPT
ncbi:MAG: type ISP restriction/modification enzyme, partial [Sphingobium sp.]